MAGQRTKLMWGNDGSSVITGLSSNPLYLPVAGDKKTDGFGAAVDSWHKIDLEGADSLDLQWSAEILAVGGLGSGAITGSHAKVTVLGQCHEDIEPSVLAGTAAAAVGSEDLANLGLQVRPWDHRGPRLTHTSDAIQMGTSTIGVFPTGVVPANGSKTHWGFEVGRRYFDGVVGLSDVAEPAPASVFGAYVLGVGYTTNQPYDPIGRLMRVTGLGVVYVNLALVSTFDAGATFATTRMKAFLRATLGYEGGSARFRRYS